MEHEAKLLVVEHNNITMGANSNPNAARLAALHERKQTLEETLAKRNTELRNLCIQEAELTGSMPLEMPLEPGESPPTSRICVATAFELPQNLINNVNTEDESVTSLELNMQVQANMAEASLTLANEPNINKTMRRQHMQQYQYHKRQYNTLQENLAFAKMCKSSSSLTQQPKQKKKPRPSEQEDTISVNLRQSELFGKPVFRHSMRSLQHPYIGESNVDHRYFVGHPKLAYRNSEGSPGIDVVAPLARQEDTMVSGIYRMSIHGYKSYMERKENSIIGGVHIPSQFVSSHSNPNLYQQQAQHLQYSPTSVHTLPHASQRHTVNLSQSIHAHHNFVYPQYSQSQMSQVLHEYNKYPGPNNHLITSASNTVNRQTSSPNLSTNSSTYGKPQYYSSHTIHGQPSYRTLNPHQIQPHQQYEYDVMTSGLGGYWKRSETGELIWCNSSPCDTWQRDKRFGSLDRRRNKRIHKRTSPCVDPKTATIAAYPDSVRPLPASKSQQLVSRRQDNRQLVRTQSLGSVGAQTVDSVWPSDDNSSCGSDANSISEKNASARKQKQKPWFETSLDGPSLPTPPPSSSHSTISSIVPSISPEEKYIETPLPPLPSPQPSIKQPLEIPAESYPNQPPSRHETNMDLFSNVVPKNCTVIQAGHCKPYHEETKPFEMSDFYKYSTKFKKSPVKLSNHNVEGEGVGCPRTPASNLTLQQMNNNFEEVEELKNIYHHTQPKKSLSFSSPSNFERSTESLGPLLTSKASTVLNESTSNMSEVNLWYQINEQKDNNNTKRHSTSGKSTATLV